MAEDSLGVQFVDAFHGQFGAHAGCRAIHAKGVFARGQFVPTAEAGRLSCSKHFRGDPVAAICRFSNGDGKPDAVDGKAFSLGFATSFEVEGEAVSDLLMVDAPEFITGEPDTFLGFVEANEVDEDDKVNIARSGGWALVHPRTTAAAIRKQKAPIARSFATQQWWAVHAFWLVNADGDQVPAKFSWHPVAGLEGVEREEAETLPSNYLIDDIEARLAAGTVAFDLVVTLGELTDPLDDCSKDWPSGRPEVIFGRLTLDRIEPDGDPRRFVPNRLGEGVRCTDDPLLQARIHTYAQSYRTRCPHKG